MAKLSAIEKELSDFIDSKDSQLENANQKLVYGDDTYPGTKLLRDFYIGNQWGSNQKLGGAKRTFNYCRRLIENNTAFLANEPPEVSVQSRDSANEVENVRAELIAKQLNEVHKYNDLPFTFQKMVKVASITGVFFLFGPIWDDEIKQITYKSFDNPENVRPIWRDSHFGEMVGFINRYKIDVTTFIRLYGDKLKERGIDPEMIKGTKTFSNYFMSGSNYGPTYDFSNILYDYPMVEVMEYYDDEYYMMKLGRGAAENYVVDFKEHKYGFIPGQYLPNNFSPGTGRGTSDIEDVLSSQLAYNESKSNEEDIIAQTAYPQYYGVNIGRFSTINSPNFGSIINLSENSKLEALPRSGTTFNLESYERNIQGDMMNLGGQNQVTFPGAGKQVLAASGRSLSVLMQPVNNNIALKKTIFGMCLEKLNRNILILMEKKVKDAKKLIDGNYNVQVFLSSVLTRDTTEEINKFNAKIQSLTTTQKNLGIPSPSEEQKLMKEELRDPILGIETARQPGLIQQAIQNEIQNQMQMAGQMENQLGVEGGNPMQMLANAGEDNPQPMNVPQQRMSAPTSPEGALNQQAQQTTGVNPVRR